jgi:hypothetical protein
MRSTARRPRRRSKYRRVPLPSLYPGHNGDRDWRPARAAIYGGGVGLAAALFKMLGPLGERSWTSATLLELGEAAAAFALLCAAAAFLRNALARWFVNDA